MRAKRGAAALPGRIALTAARIPVWASPVGRHDPGGILRGGDLEPPFAQGPQNKDVQKSVVWASPRAMFRDLPAALGRHSGDHHQRPADHPVPHAHVQVGGARRGGGTRCGPGGGRGTRARPRRCPSRIRETVEREIPDSLPGARTRSSTLRVETPSTPGGADHGASGPCPPAGGGGAGTGRRIRSEARGWRARPRWRWWPPC